MNDSSNNRINYLHDSSGSFDDIWASGENIQFSFAYAPSGNIWIPFAPNQLFFQTARFIPTGRYAYFPLGQNDILTQSFEEDCSKYKKVLSESGKKQIKFIKYESAKFENQKFCPIIQEDFLEGSEIVELPCHHIFQTEAILNWLEKENASCPICRTQLDSIEVEKEKEIIFPSF